MMTSSKVHLPLEFDDSIRILELDQSNPSRGLSGRLVSARLGEHPDYIALSYAWGDCKLTESVILSEYCSHRISKVLFGCLKELSANDNTVRLWVDQICINQDDSDEREKQIRLMAKIYSQARQVIGWLGEPTDNSEAGIELFRLLSVAKPEVAPTEMLLVMPSPQERAVRIDRAKDILKIDEASWQGAISLAQRSWFERLWVVQEVAFANTLNLRCGGSTISGETFFAAIRFLASMVLYPPVPGPPMPQFQNANKLGILREQVRASQSRSYPELANVLVGWGCSDDRDRLNALFGIFFQDIPSPWFKVSYRMTVEQLYESFAFKHIATTRSLQILRFAGYNTAHSLADSEGVRGLGLSSAYSICSWAPDWRIKTRPIPLYTDIGASQPNQFAATRSKSDYGFIRSHRELCVRAVKVDEVVLSGQALVDNIPIRGILQRIDEIFASTLIGGGRTAASRNPRYHMEEAEYVRHLNYWLHSLTDSTFHGEESENVTQNNQQPRSLQRVEPAMRFGYQATEICRNRSFFTTKSGRFGLGPSQLAPGLPIYLIHGLKVPFLLQKAHEGEGYLLRGECYVHGLMDEKATASKSDVYITLV